MHHIFRTLLIRYQNYLLEFYQLIEDKELIAAEDLPASQHIKSFLENIPELSGSFEIAFSISKQTGGLTATWSVDINEEGFSVRSFTVDDDLIDTDEWYFHYYDSTQEYEGNLFNDGDWDLFLEEVAELDDFEGGSLSCSISYRLEE